MKVSTQAGKGSYWTSWVFQWLSILVIEKAKLLAFSLLQSAFQFTHHWLHLRTQLVALLQPYWLFCCPPSTQALAQAFVSTALPRGLWLMSSGHRPVFRCHC